RRASVGWASTQSNCVLQLNVPVQLLTRLISWPPCQWTIWLPTPFAPCVNNRLFARTGVVTLSDVNRMHVGVSHPGHDPAPTDFAWSTCNAPTMYSVTGSSVARLLGATAAAIRPTALPVPISLTRQAPIPPTSNPEPQSTHAPGVTIGDPMNTNELCRHEPALWNSHHAGSVGDVVLSENRISIPLTCSMPVSSWSERIARSNPEFVLQANVLFMTPPSEKQLSQRMLM